jgi:hypothetical protein
VLALPGDDKAHTWQIEVLEGNDPTDLSGATASANFIREDGNRVFILGDISGNVCSFLMTQSCYAVKGKVRCVFRITGPSRGPVTLLEKIISIGDPVTGGIIDDGDVIPGIDDLLAQIAAMSAASAAANSAAQQAEAAAEYARSFAGIHIKGLYPTLAALEDSHPVGMSGDAYAIGTGVENEVYVWDVDAGAWTNLGAIQGPQGQTAFAAAQAGGYAGTQANFYADLAAIEGLAAQLAAM